MVQVDDLSTIQGGRRFAPVGRNIARQAILGQIQIKEKAQVPKLGDGARQVIVVYAQVA